MTRPSGARGWLAPRPVVVTGRSALSPAGVGVAAYRSWRAGAAAAGMVPDFDPARYIASPKLLRSMHRSFQLGVAAAALAMREAGLPDAASLPRAGIAAERAGIAAAVADLSPLTGDLLEVLRQLPCAPGEPPDWARFAELSLHQLHPFRRLTLLANMAAAHTSLLLGLQGPSFTFTSGAAGGAQAIAQAYWTVAHDRADLMLCQAAESPEQSFAAAPPPELAGALVLEAETTARARGAVVLARLGPEDVPEGGGGAGLSPVASLMSALAGIADRGAAGAAREVGS